MIADQKITKDVSDSNCDICTIIQAFVQSQKVNFLFKSSLVFFNFSERDMHL